MDYNETFAFIIKMTIVHTLIAIVFFFSPTQMYCDNMSAIQLLTTLSFMKGPSILRLTVITNVFKIGSIIESKKLSVHGSLVGLTIESVTS